LHGSNSRQSYGMHLAAASVCALKWKKVPEEGIAPKAAVTP
jgi:hypothetical protein